MYVLFACLSSFDLPLISTLLGSSPAARCSAACTVCRNVLELLFAARRRVADHAETGAFKGSATHAACIRRLAAEICINECETGTFKFEATQHRKVSFLHKLTLRLSLVTTEATHPCHVNNLIAQHDLSRLSMNCPNDQIAQIHTVCERQAQTIREHDCQKRHRITTATLTETSSTTLQPVNTACTCQQNSKHMLAYTSPITSLHRS